MPYQYASHLVEDVDKKTSVEAEVEALIYENFSEDCESLTQMGLLFNMCTVQGHK